MLRTVIALTLLAAAALPVRAERIKDIIEIQGIRSNQLKGVGLLVGLDGTGDGSMLSRRMLNNHLRRSGLVFEPDDLSGNNIAAVEVTAELPPFARQGTRIDVTVSAIAGASSLQGGVLVMTELTGADGEVYAVAHGPITVGGFSAIGERASVTKNHVTVGMISGGATVEREELASFENNGEIFLLLRNPDFTTARRIAEEINEKIAPRSSTVVDPGTVRLRLPENFSQRHIVAFVDRIFSLEVEVDFPAVVVINERTGTIVIGQNVSISTVAISHGNLSIVTEEKDFVSQPLPFSRGGQTERARRTEVTTIEEQGELHVLPAQVSVAELARALNAMGLTARDIVSIFQALRQAGALQAELKII